VEPMRQLAAQGAMIAALSSDSRRCAPGVAFLAYPGEKADGRAYIADAIRRGASAVLWEAAGFAWRHEWAVPNVAVNDLKRHAGKLAHEFYGRPSEALWVCGVTGTNGKTSCSQWIAGALSAHGAKSAVVGTLGAGFPGALVEAVNTTPDALEIHRMMKEFRVQGAKALAMEVSSHGLVQGRVSGVAFDCALFTNLSHDHLDYHGSMEAYAEAKATLFETSGLEVAVLNLDDVAGVRLAQRLEGRGLRIIGYSLSGTRNGTPEFLAATRVAHAEMDLVSSWGRGAAKVNQLGRFNIANALGVAACLIAYGLPFQDALRALEKLPPVPGRMQQVGDKPLVVVDYAHTPDALEKVLQALRPVASARGGRLIAVFGAGGDRDAAKRPVMGAVVSRLADRAVVTSDNPRSEDPLKIIEAIRGGIAGGCEVEPDRAKAIEAAIAAAGEADVVLIAGKGHETVQEFHDHTLPFDDRQVAHDLLNPSRPTTSAGVMHLPEERA
jgi:UDP-N-acetylmuramoyl-L-alanyl-D-glutamate--2,6-diaminopimelate ligase